jgi:hypothetical protein
MTFSTRYHFATNDFDPRYEKIVRDQTRKLEYVEDRFQNVIDVAPPIIRRSHFDEDFDLAIEPHVFRNRKHDEFSIVLRGTREIVTTSRVPPVRIYRRRVRKY